MGLRDGSWLVNLEGYPLVSTDDLTLDELEVAERVTGVPYTLMDPHVSVRIAKGLLTLLLIRANLAGGMTQQAAEDDALERARKLTTRALHGAFVWQPATLPARAGTAEPAGPPAPAPTSVTG